MHCTTCRSQLHDWFDSQGVGTMPPNVREHVRDCTDCRTFIKNWNAVEIGLQSLRDQTSALSPDFSVALRARLAREEARRTIRIPFPSLPAANYRRLALAALTVLLIVLAVRFSGQARSLFVRHSVTIASSATQAKTDDVKPAIPPDLPIANTNTAR